MRKGWVKKYDEHAGSESDSKGQKNVLVKA